MPTAIDIEVDGLTEVADRFKKASAASVRIALNEALRRVGQLFVPSKGTGPLAMATPKVTGKLARSSFFQIMGQDIGQWLQVMQPARTPEGKFYGGWVRGGTDPHEIRPKTAKALRFQIGGEIVFAMKVSHPGSRANPYHQRLLTQNRGRIQTLLTHVGKKVTVYLSDKGD